MKKKFEYSRSLILSVYLPKNDTDSHIMLPLPLPIGTVLDFGQYFSNKINFRIFGIQFPVSFIYLRL